MRKPPFSDEVFKREFKKGYEYQMLIALEFLRNGYIVQSSTDSLADTYEERKKDRDNGDLFISKSWNPKKKRLLQIEVTSRNLLFKSPQDFPYEDIIVCSVHDWKKDRNADYFVVVSQKTKSAICIATSSKADWTKRKIRDRVRNTNEYVYCAPKSCFISFEQLLKEIS